MISYQYLTAPLRNERILKIREVSKAFKDSVLNLTDRIGSLGTTKRMAYLEKRKLKIFNLIVFFQLIAIAIMPVESIFSQQLRPVISAGMLLPAFINCLVLWLNYYQNYDAARIFYFIVSPVITGLIYMGGINLGVELNFVLYGILAVFFIANIGEMIFSIGLSMLTFYMLSFILNNYQFELKSVHLPFYLFNQVITLIFIFYGLYLIKKENTIYQHRLVVKGQALYQKNQQIKHQRTEITQKANLLEKQTVELKELNTVKDKLFSIIAHDMKAPLYALRNLFQQVHQNDQGEEIKQFMPDIITDLNFTTELMDNLLSWSKSQMQSVKTKPQLLEISDLTENVLQLLSLSAKNKKIHLESTIGNGIYAFGDRDMIQLVLRNLISNAIKFTPPEGKISLGAKELESEIEIFVKDTGRGMNREVLNRVLKNEFYSTKGTANESGTGLGLMLCKEFVHRNRGVLLIESCPGSGSIFRFTLPKVI